MDTKQPEQRKQICLGSPGCAPEKKSPALTLVPSVERLSTAARAPACTSAACWCKQLRDWTSSAQRQRQPPAESLQCWILLFCRDCESLLGFTAVQRDPCRTLSPDFPMPWISPLMNQTLKPLNSSWREWKPDHEKDVTSHQLVRCCLSKVF